MAAGRLVRVAVGVVLGVGVLFLGAGWAEARGVADEPEVRRATERGVRARRSPRDGHPRRRPH